MPTPEVGEAAPDIALLDTSGDEVHLSSYWQDRPAVVSFLRHWG